MKRNGSGLVRWMTGVVIATLVVTVGVSAVSASVELVDAEPAPAAEPQVLSTTLRAVAPRVEAPVCPSGQLFSAETDTYADALKFFGSEATLSVEGFDSSLGTLQSARFDTTIGVRGSGTFTNTDPSGSATLEVFASVTASLENTLGHANISVAEQADLGLNLGPVAFDVSAPFEFTNSFGTGSAVFDTQAVAAPFVGGTIDWQLSAAGTVAYQTGPQASLDHTTNLTASVRATYCYTPPPGTFTISKTVDAGEGATIPTFRFAVACSNGTERIVSLAAGESETVELQPANTTCSVAELFDNDEAGRWAPAFNGECGQSIDGVGDGDTVAVTNTLWDVYATCPAAASGG